MQQGIVQRAVKQAIPDGTRIIIDGLGAQDFGDTGRIIRDSQTGPGCKVVEFDNERGKFYRVYLHEMSPINPGEKAEYGLEGRYSKQFATMVTITASIDLSDPANQSANFIAYNGSVKIGKLFLKKTDELGFIISDIYTNLAEDRDFDVPNLGVVFLNLSALVAQKLNSPTMSLTAHQSTDKHPAPFYKKFQFTSKEVEEAADISMDFAEYMSIIGKSIPMRASTEDVGVSTGRYLADKGF